MAEAYLTERMYRSVSHLTLGSGDLRTRLPEAYDEGFASIATKEVQAVSPDLALRFAQITATFTAHRQDGEGRAALSVADLSDEDLARTAAEILDIHAIASDIIETKRLKT